MPARVDETDSGNYVVEHAEAMGDVAAGSPFFESTGFGPLVFRTRARATAVAMALNAEIEERSRPDSEEMEEMAMQMAREMMGDS